MLLRLFSVNTIDKIVNKVCAIVPLYMSTEPRVFLRATAV